MKFTKIIMAAAACIALTAGTTMAQNGRFSVGAELALPMGGFGDQGGIGFGGSLRYEFPIGDKMGITATAGYLTFAGKTTDYALYKADYSTSMIPIQGGFKYYFKEAQDGFYAIAELGVHLVTTKAKSDGYSTIIGYDNNFNPIYGTVGAFDESSSKTGLSYAPGIGYHLANLDFSVKYQIFTISETVDTGFGSVSATSTSGYVGARVAYVFGEK